jgi:hypothetical protein
LEVRGRRRRRRRIRRRSTPKANKEDQKTK